MCEQPEDVLSARKAQVFSFQDFVPFIWALLLDLDDRWKRKTVCKT